MHDNNNIINNAISNSTSFQQVELFAIQRCWFSGPNIEPPVDCRRLFLTRREAEEVAYHSAHAYANQVLSKQAIEGVTRQQLNASVRTTLLPVHQPNQPPASSHAFQTCGKLFWVRSLKATVVPHHVGTNQSAGLTYPVTASTLADASFSKAAEGNNSIPYSSAEVILTQNVIGGTGNPNSRRGTEISEGRVILCSDASHANRCAVQLAQQLHFQFQHNPHFQISVVQVPIGKAHLGQNETDWPVNATVVNGHHYSEDMMQQTMMDDTTMMKRDWQQQEQQRQQELPGYQQEDHDPLFLQDSTRPAKRQCHSFFAQGSPHKQEAASDVPCSMMFG